MLIFFHYSYSSDEKKNIQVNRQYMRIKKNINYQNILDNFVNNGTNGKDVEKILQNLLHGTQKIQRITGSNPVINKTIYDIHYLSSQIKNFIYTNQDRKNIAYEVNKIIDNQTVFNNDLNKNIASNQLIFKNLVESYNKLNLNTEANGKYEQQLNNIYNIIKQLKIISSLLQRQEISQDMVEIYWNNQYHDKYSLLAKQNQLLNQLKNDIDIIEPKSIYKQILQIFKKEKNKK